MSSLHFIGNETSYLRIPNNDLNFGTGDFTIEWYQYQMDSNPFPRIFEIGNYTTSISIGVSIEGGSFYYWTNSTPNYSFYLNDSQYKNKWVHFAISRSSGTTRIFMNGTSMVSINDTTDFTSSDDLVIGNETTPSTIAAFGGYMTYFSWVKGIAKYTSNFKVPTVYPTLTSNYLLLLKAGSFIGTLGNTVVNNNVGVINQVPPGFGSIPPTPIPTPTLPNFRNIGSLFTDNAMVYYRKGLLSSCGVGSVRNSSVKSKRI
jgi:Concanavalin A-like lectin/glucanases superfamily